VPNTFPRRSGGLGAAHAARFEEQVGLAAELDVGAMWGRMLGEFLGEWERQQRGGVSGAELERHMLEYMDALSDKPVEDLARQASTVAYNQGRDVALRMASDSGLVEYVVRSEVLDDRTCEPCAALDGSIVEVGSDEYEKLQPPSLCDGGDRCRGFYVPVPPGELG